MISVYFLHVTHLAQCFFSRTRRKLLNFQPIRSMLKFYLGITKEDCPFIRVAYSDSRSLGLPPNSNRDFLFDIWQDALFLHASENSVTILLSHMNSDTQSEKEIYHFLSAAHRLACSYCSLYRIRTFPHCGFIQRL